MKIEVIIDSWMRYLGVGSSPIVLDVTENTTTTQILMKLAIDKEEIGIVTFNGTCILLDQPLIAEGQLRFYPNILGG